MPDETTASPELSTVVRLEPGESERRLAAMSSQVRRLATGSVRGGRVEHRPGRCCPLGGKRYRGGQLDNGLAGQFCTRVPGLDTASPQVRFWSAGWLGQSAGWL